jgi:phosphoribosylformylglycinamidine synthase subunit PurQ / glutaminase
MTIKICVLRVGGTICDAETKSALEDLGTKTEIVHFKKLVERGNLNSYDALVVPGGFSYGDHIRAGVILGKKVGSTLSKEMKKFVGDKKPILGICNGFQVLVESGLLPGFDGISAYPKAALAINNSARYECRWIYLKHENRGNCIFTKKLQKGQKIYIPVAHGEGKFVFSKEKESEYLKKLKDNDQLVFRYCDEMGEYANGRYPVNPNGALYDIAGICDPSGTILGLMPHPERAYWGFQLPNWTSMDKVPDYVDGRQIFESLVEYLKER